MSDITVTDITNILTTQEQYFSITTSMRPVNSIHIYDYTLSTPVEYT